MQRQTYPVRSCALFSITALLTLLGVSCTPAISSPIPTTTHTSTPTSTPSPVIQTVEVTREVTQEITRIVEIPVTITPSLTPDISLTPSLTPTITPTPNPPVVSVLIHAACYYGPGSEYLYKYGLNATSWMEVIGRNLDGTWLLVQGVHGWNPCWMDATQARFNDGGDITTHDIPIVYMGLPRAMNLYRPPESIQAIRSGSKVTIYWSAVWMTEDDYNGYLIEAYLCQGGQLVFRPLLRELPIEQNVGLQSMVVTDEPGCLLPSSAIIYTAEKHGYTGYKMIPWPPYDETTATPTLTPTSTPTP